MKLVNTWRAFGPPCVLIDTTSDIRMMTDGNNTSHTIQR